jgi:hypothetical protein
MNADTILASSLASSEPDQLGALQAVIGALSPLDDEARHRILDAVATFLKIGRSSGIPSSAGATRTGQQDVRRRPTFSEDTSMSPKEFLLEKQPRTDVERIACLAYYLTHYRDTPNFKTLDLSKLNTEAAQPKFSNAANATNNAVKTGYLVPSTKGQRQISAAGEQFVQALPDRDAAKSAMIPVRARRKPRKSALTNGAVRG